MQKPKASFLPGKELSTLSDGLNGRVRAKWEIKLESSGKYSYPRRIQVIAEKSRLRPDLVVLDVGCGTGAELAEMAWLGGNCTGVNLD